ncbi:hypothetical protein [Caballeronia grimmiae]|uniref:hypothetical protein n=1 Tax=Caballeronia grimmiae TaxID=1071679 RepID=UPI0038BAC46D
MSVIDLVLVIGTCLTSATTLAIMILHVRQDRAITALKDRVDALPSRGGEDMIDSLEQIKKQTAGLAARPRDDHLIKAIDKRLDEFVRLHKMDRIMTSPVDQLQSILGRWHQYNVSRKDNKLSWIHVEYDIQATPAGVLEFTVEYADNQGGRADFVYEGVIRNDRVVLIGRAAKGSQSCFVEIWPHLGNWAQKYHFGVCFNESWDKHETLISCVMSRHEIEPCTDAALDALWIEHVRSSLGPDIFPRLRSQF